MNLETPASLVQSIESAIISLQWQTKVPKSLYEPMAYILSLKGKRIRPILVLLAFQAYSKQPV
ncbi:MAG: polyprenyl synthetase family protein, partial [Bacteroidia bacterium]|nr:polyprenyl synthetase family protein [Bacteroidia bacterium]